LEISCTSGTLGLMKNKPSVILPGGILYITSRRPRGKRSQYASA
jgi:hypothetical protein